MHGIPGATVDVVVDGEIVVPGFEPGTMQDISAFAGQTLTNVEVRAAGTTDVVIGPIASLAVPASGNWTVLAHLDAAGTPTLTPFENDTSTIPAGQGRLVVRHTAAAPAVDIVLADGSRPFTNLSNPNEASAALPAGEIAGAKVAPTGGDPDRRRPDRRAAGRHRPHRLRRRQPRRRIVHVLHPDDQRPRRLADARQHRRRPARRRHADARRSCSPRQPCCSPLAGGTALALRRRSVG